MGGTDEEGENGRSDGVGEGGEEEENESGDELEFHDAHSELPGTLYIQCTMYVYCVHLLWCLFCDAGKPATLANCETEAAEHMPAVPVVFYSSCAMYTYTCTCTCTFSL